MIDMLDLKHDLEDCSVQQLENIRKMVEDKIEVAASVRYNFLRDQILSAYRMMEKEFPSSEIWIENEYGDEMNLINYDLNETNFHQ